MSALRPASDCASSKQLQNDQPCCGSDQLSSAAICSQVGSSASVSSVAYQSGVPRFHAETSSQITILHHGCCHLLECIVKCKHVGAVVPVRAMRTCRGNGCAAYPHLFPSALAGRVEAHLWPNRFTPREIVAVPIEYQAGLMDPGGSLHVLEKR